MLVRCRSIQNRNRLQLIMTWIFGGNIPFSQQKNNDSQSIKHLNVRGGAEGIEIKESTLSSVLYAFKNR